MGCGIIGQTLSIGQKVMMAKKIGCCGVSQSSGTCNSPLGGGCGCSSSCVSGDGNEMSINYYQHDRLYESHNCNMVAN